MLLAHKIALDPNAEQRLYFVRAAGTARFAWNWALAEWKRQYKAGERPTEVSLRRQLNAIKREQFPWMYDVTKAAAQEAIIDLGSAFLAFFEKRCRYPRFKRKDDRASFCAANEVGTFRTNGKRIKLPVIGWVKMREAGDHSPRDDKVTAMNFVGKGGGDDADRQRDHDQSNEDRNGCHDSAERGHRKRHRHSRSCPA